MIALAYMPALTAQERALDGYELSQLSIAAGRSLELELPERLAGPLTLSVTLDGVPRTLQLEPHSVRAPSFKLVEIGANGLRKQVDAPPPATLRGTVDGFPESRIAGSLSGGRLQLLLRLDEDSGLWAIQPLSNGRHALYRRADLVGAGAICGTFAPHDAGPVALQALTPGTELAETEINFDADYEYYQLNFSSTTTVMADIEAITAQSGLLYSNALLIRYLITEISVRTSPNDPYTQSDSSALLNEFRGVGNAGNLAGVQRDVSHLFTGRDLDFSVAGVAYIDAICNLGIAYGLSQSRITNNLIQRVTLTTHELGHNWAAYHCDGAPDCGIMCAVLGQCAGGYQQFGTISKALIAAKRDAVNCLGVYVVPLIPILSDSSPSFGPAEGGDVLELYGVDLLEGGMPSVTVGDAPAEVLSMSDTLVSVTVPPGTGGKTVNVTLSTSLALTVLDDAYRYELDLDLGDSVVSQFSPSEVERFYFSGFAGASLTALLIPLDADQGLIAGLRLIGPGDEELIELEGSVPKKGQPVVLKKFVLPETGEYRLEAYSLGITHGEYQLKTKLLPMKALKEVTQVSSAEPETTLVFSALEGTLLKLAHFKRLAPKGKFKLVDGEPADLTPTILGLDGPSGPIDISALLQLSPKGKWARFKQLELTESGEYTLRFGGLDDSIGHGRARVKLKPPKIQGTSIELDN